MALRLKTVSNPEKVGVFNENFKLLQDFINDRLLQRDKDELSDPNHLENDLDVNGHKLLNVDFEGSNLATKVYVDSQFESLEEDHNTDIADLQRQIDEIEAGGIGDYDEGELP